VFPIGAAQQKRYIATWRRFGKQCKRRDKRLMAHVSTADTARDLDLLRRAVGERSLTYIGLSYGTFLGATYANLFPGKVRALALDGNLAPSAWTANGDRDPAVGISLRIGSDLGAGQNLAALLDLCGRVSPARCAPSRPARPPPRRPSSMS
jgi:pimeloyl-ACP methyl ester carboxylesterase